MAADLLVPESTPLGPVDIIDESLEARIDALVRMIARGGVVTPISLSLVGVKSWMSETRRLVADLNRTAALG